MSTPFDHIGNTVSIEGLSHYAAILGESPSKGARSPVLWNAAFEAHDINARMVPMDVTPEALPDLVAALRNDDKFIGGAVAMPYKSAIMPLLDRIEEQAQTIGAINCIYRSGDTLVGCNTDGAGAIWSLKQAVADLAGSTALLIGCGGAGSAVATYVAHEIGKEGLLKLANRDSSKAQEMVEKLSAVSKTELTQLPLEDNALAGVDILINCTSLGFEPARLNGDRAQSLKFYTPLAEAELAVDVPADDKVEQEYCKVAATEIGANVARSLEVLTQASPKVIMDIVYQPERTLLLSISDMFGAQTINGLGMNLEQAVIAYDKATATNNLRDADADAVRSIMASA